jgi:hypothetical protein
MNCQPENRDVNNSNMFNDISSLKKISIKKQRSF